MSQRIAIRPSRRRDCRNASRLLAPIVISWVITSGSFAAEAPPRLDRDATEAVVKAFVAGQGERVRTGIWLGGSEGEALYARGPEQVLPTASAIKTAILVELFARFPDALDQPPPGLEKILADEHPAIAHFRPEVREQIRKELGGVSVRRIGEIMMGCAPAPNLVYNAAANVSIALLGGPAGTTRAIHDRDPSFAPIVVRRYMLTDRKVAGDNEATPAALAAVLQRLASRSLRGIRGTTVEDIRRAVVTRVDPRLGRIYRKDGALASDPITRVRAGWCETPGGSIIYVVMLALDDLGSRTRDEAEGDLEANADRLTKALLDGVKVAPR